MKKTIITFSISLSALLAITWFGCQKEYNPSGLNITDSTTTSSLSITEKVTASLQGRIFDENGKPASGVTVKAATVSVITDVNGSFSFTNIQFSKNAGFISIEKIGYFKTYKTFFTSAGTINFTEARLIPRVLKGTFANAAGGTIAVENSSVKFTANSIVTASTNTAYIGTVNVFAAYLDPSNSLIGLTMPGNLTGLDTANKLTLMRSLGMMVVELEGASGEKLQIASGKTATITSVIPSSLTAFAPSTIPLWYFNDTLGLWKQQGVATKQGNNYVGDVPHFSFWNCDVAVNSIALKMNLKNQSGQAMSYSKVTLTNTVNNSTTFGFTDTLGMVAGVIPNGVALQLNVYDKCGGILLTKTVGPFSTNTDLGTIMVNVGTASSVTISGSVVNCSSAAVTNGFAEIRLDGNIYRAATDANGKFSIVINRCNNTATQAIITATDLQTNQQGADTTTVQTGIFNAGIIKACGNVIDQIIICTINNVAYTYIAPPDSAGGWYGDSTGLLRAPNTSIGADDYNDPKHPLIHIYTGGDTVVGHFTVNGFLMEYYNGATKLQVLGNNIGAITASYLGTYTEYGGVGQYISGSFSGDAYLISNNVTTKYPMTCTFKVKRQKNL